MKKPPLPLLFCALCALGLTLPGCRKNAPEARTDQPEVKPALPLATAKPPAEPPPTAITCLTDEYGVCQKVILTEPGIRWLDRPGGKLAGAPLRYFWPYFVHAVSPARGEPAFFQISPSPRADSARAWVPAAAAVRWPTRVGAAYLPPYPLLVYRDKAPLVEIIQTGSTRAAPLARATPSGKCTWMPWPIAEVHQFTWQGRTHELVRLLFVGEFREGADLARPEDHAVSDGYTHARLHAIKEGVRHLRVVFVVDNTASTFPFLSTIIQAIEQIARDLQALPSKPKVSYALVLYRDHVPAILFDTEAGPSAVRVFPFEADLPTFRARVQGLSPAREGSEDWPEAVYDGVHAGLTRLPWGTDGLSEQVLVLIGDNSAHPPGHPKNPQGHGPDGLTRLARDGKVRIFGMCIDGAGGPEEQALHRRQWEELARDTGGDCYTPGEADKVVARLRDLMRVRAKKVDARITYLDHAARGRPDDQVPLDVRERTEVMEFFQEAGVDVRRLGPGVPCFSTGWCMTQAHGRPLIDKKVFVSRPELDLLLAELNTLTAFLSPDDVRRTLQLAGEYRIDPRSFFAKRPGDTPSETFDTFMRKKQILPSSQGLLRLTRAEIEHMPEEPRARLRDRLSRQVIPSLLNARNDDRVFAYCGDLEYGWIEEALFP